MSTEFEMEPDTKKARRPLTFLAGFLRHPKEVGSVIPSSRTLIRRILQFGGVEEARTIVELGPGTGVITKPMLRAMPADSRVVGMEINPLYIRTLREDIADPRFTVHEGAVIGLPEALGKIGTETADLVISGIPFSTLERAEAIRTLENVRDHLAPGGRFLAYQFRSEVKRLADPVFGPGETHQGYWNIPPMRIYVWQR